MGRRAWFLSTIAVAAVTLALASPTMAQNAIVDAYNAYQTAIAAGDQPNADAAMAALNAECGALGYGDLNQCVSDAFNPPAQAVEQAPAGPTPDEIEAMFQQEVAPALNDYATAINTANGGGDYDQAQALSNDAAARVSQICANHGRPAEPAACLGYGLEAFPPRPQPAGPTPEELEAEFQQAIAGPIGDFNAAYDLAASGGDYTEARARADDATARIAQVCANYNRGDVASCVGQLADLPQPAATAAGDPGTAAPETPPQPDTAAITAAIQAAYADYMSVHQQATEGGDLATLQPLADKAAGRILTNCQLLGAQSIVECIQMELPPLASAPAAATAGDPGTAAPETPPQPDTAAITAAIQAAYADYMSVHQQAADGGDLATLQPLADEASGRILTNCQLLGAQTIVECIQMELPPLAPAATADAMAGGDPARSEAELRAELRAGHDDYITAYLATLSGTGDFAELTRRAADARARIEATCTALGVANLVACVGAELPVLPDAPVQAAGGTDADGATTPETAAALTEDEKTQIVARGTAAAQAYVDAVASVHAGADYAAARANADTAFADLQAVCTALGVPAIPTCIGQDLPPFPEASTTVAGTPAAPADDFAGMIRAAVADYNANVPTQVDPSFSRQDVTFQISFLCNQAGLGDVDACLAGLGLAINAPANSDNSTELLRAAVTPGAALAAYAGLQSGTGDRNAHIATIDAYCRQQGYPTTAGCNADLGSGITRNNAPDAAGVALDGSRQTLDQAPAGALPLPEAPAAVPGTPALTQNAITDAYNAYVAAQASGDAAAIDGALPALTNQCIIGGYPTFADCIAALSAATVAAASPSDPLAAAEASIRAAADLYAQGAAKLGAGDASGQADIDAAASILQQNCGPLGFASNEECVANYGLTLPPLPDGLPATAAPASPQQASDPLAAAEAGIRSAADLYIRGTAKLGAGDASGQADIDAAASILQQNCAPLGFASNEECVANYGLILPAGGPQVADTAAAISKLEESRARLEGGAPVLTQAERIAQQGAASNAYAAYLMAIREAATDHAAASAKAQTAKAELEKACAALGVTVSKCIEGDLPPFPEPRTQVTAAPENSCQYAFDGECDEVGLGTGACAASTDTNDCRPPAADATAATAAEANSCQYAFDGECDDVGLGTGACAAGTDAADCRPAVAAPAISPCPNLQNGTCAEPGTGIGTAVPADTKTATAVADLARARGDYEAGNAGMIALLSSGRTVADDPGNQVEIAAALNEITAACNVIAGSEVINLASPMSALDDCLKANGVPALSPSWQETVATVLANLKMMVDDYNAYAQSTAPFDKDGLQRAIGNYCAASGLGELRNCLNTAGLLLVDQSVTTTTMEQLPDGTTPANAAPLLDSAKGNTGGATTTPDGGATTPAGGTPTITATPPARGTTTTTTTTTTLASLTPLAVPRTDAEAQTNLPRVTLPATFEPGMVIDPSTVSFTPPKSRPVGTTGGGQTGGQGSGGTSIAFSATMTPDGGFVFSLGAQVVVSNPEQERNRLFDPEKDRIGYEKLADGRIRETVTRPDGKQVITIRNNSGEVVQRDVVMPGGRSFTLAAGTGPKLPGEEGDGRWRDPGDDLPPLRLTIPAGDYVLDADGADEDDVAFFLVQPPVERVARIYSVEEVKRSARVRDSVRRLEISDLTFDSGKSTLPRDQFEALEEVADAMLQLLDRDAAETFLIEGHTDAVGTEISNLELSDDRAIEIATILSEEFGIPPENLVTQGYGETYLKIETAAAERLNRRATIRRITPLIRVAGMD